MQTFEIKLGDETIELKLTPNIGKAINNAFGGFVPAFEAVQKVDYQAITLVIALGSDRTSPAQISALEQGLFDAGIGTKLPEISAYLDRLANGGKAVEVTSPSSTEPPAQAATEGTVNG